MSKPLNLDWNELLPDESNNSTQVDEVEVIKTPNCNGFLSQRDEFKLPEQIHRMRSSLKSNITKCLPDKGEKLRHKLKELEEEFDRRERNKISKKDTDLSCQPNPAGSSGPYHGSSPCTTKKPSSFGYLFEAKLDKRGSEYGKPITGNNSQPKRKKGEQLNQNKTKNNYAPLPLESQSHCNDKFSNRARELSSAGKSICSSLFKRISFSGMSLSRSRKNSSEDSCALDQRSKKVKDIVLLDDEEVEADVLLPEDALTDRNPLKLYYPSRDDSEAIELTNSDIQCLKPGTYLTSPIMNFYIRYLQRQLSLTGRNGDYHFFNTYFYKKLFDVTFKCDKDEQFLKLRRWWKGVNIFETAYIFLPIHGDMHWSLLIICMPNKDDALGPVMLHLDSLGIHSSVKIFNVVKHFLIEEWCYLNKNDPPYRLPFSDKIWENLPCEINQQNLTVPQQKNEYDCGLFVLYFMEKFIEEAPKRFRKRYISKFDRSTGRNWFKPEEASGLRKRIKHVIDEQCQYAEYDEDDEKVESPNHSGGSSHSRPHELIDIY